MDSVREKAIKKKKYCRKKRIVRHANPLFDKWLMEWEREASNMGSNMKFNYRRARMSLKLFPLPVYNGGDCKVLAHFGDKICQMLDQKLRRHVDEEGPVNWDEIHQVMGTPATKRKPRKKAEPKKRKSVEKTVASSDVSTPDNNVSINGRKGRAYVPSYRSGAYALLVTLFNHSEGMGSGYMKKAELMEAAQPLCNASFSQAADGSHFTAWSSMGTLVKKNLVSRESNPSKYSLTAEGKALAAKLVSVSYADSGFSSLEPSQSSDVVEDVITLSSRSCSPCSISNSPAKTNGFSVGNSDLSDTHVMQKGTLSYANKPKNNHSNNLTEIGKCKENKVNPGFSVCSEGSEKSPTSKFSTEHSDTFVFSYVTSLEMETPVKDRAVVCVEEDGFLGFLIKCRLSSLLKSDLSYRIDDSRTAPIGFTYAYISNECAPDKCPGLRSPSQKSLGSSKIQAFSNGVHLVDDNSRNAATSAVPNKKARSESKVSSKSTGNSVSSKSLESMLSSKSIGSAVSNTSSAGWSEKLTSKPSVHKSVDPVPSIKRFCAELPVSCHPPFSMLAGLYEIVLCVDNCETKGGFQGVSKFNTKEIIINELNKYKISYDVRKLHVGDFLWIARERTSSQNGTGQPKELVLPYIVERKRMDDLASSIRDGRFKEQKFRLKQSGLSKSIYLVEEYGTQNLSLPESTCMQAITNTQVVDGFTVKITKDQQESAAFLTIMTRCLQSKYQGKTVRSVTAEDVQSQQHTASTGTVETALMTFTDFNTSSMKNRQLPVREMFAKHLLQLHGLSVDKAKAVVEKYGTPASLMSTYASLENPNESENMLSLLRCGKTGRNLGPALSVNIAKLYSNLILK